MDFNEIPDLISSIQTRLTTLESQVAALESAAAPPADNTDAEDQARLAEECASLRRQLQETDCERRRLEEELSNLQRQADDRVAGEADLAVLQTQVQQLQRDLGDKSREYQGAISELDKLRKDGEIAGQRVQAMEAELAGARNNQAAMQRELDSYRKSAANTSALLERFWPSCLNAGVLQQFHEQWRAELGRTDASPTLLCMFANIFSWSCFNELLKSKDQTDNDLERAAYTALHTFSRYFLDWLYESGKSSDEAAGISRELAVHINERLSADNAKYAIEVDEVDLQDTFSSALMQAVPQGNSTGHVKRLHSWAIIHSANRGICLLKAMVLL